MAGLYRLAEFLLANFVTLARAAIAKDGFIVFEWPAYTRLWEERSVVGMATEFHLTRVTLHGCAIGLCTKDGTLAKKPWALATNSSEMARAFQKLLCDGSHARSTGMSGAEL